MECYPYYYTVAGVAHIAGAAEVSISIEAILATYCAFDAETFSISSYTDIIDGIPVYLRVVIFWPRRSRPCRRRGPVYERKNQHIWSK